MKASSDYAIPFLATRVNYNAATGEFVWLQNAAGSTRWNGRWAGNVAGKANDGYVRIRISISGRSWAVKAHRLAWFMTHGELPAGDIDHINGNSLDNRAANLRDVPRSTNRRNSRMQKNNASGACGVSWSKKFGKWMAQAASAGKNKFLGYFDSVSDAAMAARKFRELNGYTNRHGVSA